MISLNVASAAPTNDSPTDKWRTVGLIVQTFREKWLQQTFRLARSCGFACRAERSDLATCPGYFVRLRWFFCLEARIQSGRLLMHPILKMQELSKQTDTHSGCRRSWVLQLHATLFCFRSEILHPGFSVTVNSRISFPSCFTIWMWKRRLWTSIIVIFLQPFWCSICTDFAVSFFFLNTKVYSAMASSSAADESRIMNLRSRRSHFPFSCCIKIPHYRQFSSFLHHFPTCCIQYLSAKYLLVDRVEIKDSQSHVTAVTSLLGCYTLLIRK